MNVKCEGCQRKVKKVLQKVQGVYSINIDAEGGKVEITSTVDPRMLVMLLTQAGKKAELLWEQRHPSPPPMNNQSHFEYQYKSMPIAPGSAPQSAFDHHGVQLAQLHELSKVQRLKHLEITQSRNIKMTFNDHNDDPYTKITMDDMQVPQMHSGLMNGPDPHHVNSSGPSQYGGGGGGGGTLETKSVPYAYQKFDIPCVGSYCREKPVACGGPPSVPNSGSHGPSLAQYGGGGGAHETKNVPFAYQKFDIPCVGSHCREKPVACGGPPPVPNSGSHGPSLAYPPPGYHAPRGAAPVDVPHANYFCGDDRDRCIVM